MLSSCKQVKEKSERNYIQNDVLEHPFESPGGQNEVPEQPFQSQGGQGGGEPETDEGDRVFGPCRRRLWGAILVQNL